MRRKEGGLSPSAGDASLELVDDPQRLLLLGLPADLFLHVAELLVLVGLERKQPVSGPARAVV